MVFADASSILSSRRRATGSVALAWPCHRFAARRHCQGQVRRRGFRHRFPAIVPPVVDFIRGTIYCVTGLSIWSTSLQRSMNDVFDDLSAGVAVLVKRARRRCEEQARPTFTTRQSKRRAGLRRFWAAMPSVPRQCLAKRSAHWSGGRGATRRRRSGGVPAAGRRRHAGSGKPAAAASTWHDAVSIQRNIAHRPGRRSHRETDQRSSPRQCHATVSIHQGFAHRPDRWSVAAHCQ